MYTDKSSVEEFIQAATYLIDNKDQFITTYSDCKATGPEFAAGVTKLMPLTHEGVLTSAIKSATLAHPLAFPTNLLKAKSNFADGNYRKAGEYAGSDVHFILDAATTTSKPSVDDLETFTDHFWQAAFDLPLHLESCTQNTESSL